MVFPYDVTLNLDDLPFWFEPVADEPEPDEPPAKPVQWPEWFASEQIEGEVGE